jgi:hypothetical protein
MLDTFSDQRTDLSFTVDAVPRQRRHSHFQMTRGTNDRPILGDQVPSSTTRYWAPFSVSWYHATIWHQRPVFVYLVWKFSTDICFLLSVHPL